MPRDGEGQSFFGQIMDMCIDTGGIRVGNRSTGPGATSQSKRQGLVNPKGLSWILSLPQLLLQSLLG